MLGQFDLANATSSQYAQILCRIEKKLAKHVGPEEFVQCNSNILLSKQVSLLSTHAHFRLVFMIAVYRRGTSPRTVAVVAHRQSVCRMPRKPAIWRPTWNGQHVSGFSSAMRYYRYATRSKVTNTGRWTSRGDIHITDFSVWLRTVQGLCNL